MVTINLDGFSLANLKRFAKLSPRQTYFSPNFPAIQYGI